MLPAPPFYPLTLGTPDPCTHDSNTHTVSLLGLSSSFPEKLQSSTEECVKTRYAERKDISAGFLPSRSLLHSCSPYLLGGLLPSSVAPVYSRSFLFPFSSYIPTGLLWDLAHPWDLEETKSLRKRLPGPPHQTSLSFSPGVFHLPVELGLCYLVRVCGGGGRRRGWGMGGRSPPLVNGTQPTSREPHSGFSEHRMQRARLCLQPNPLCYQFVNNSALPA